MAEVVAVKATPPSPSSCWKYRRRKSTSDRSFIWQVLIVQGLWSVMIFNYVIDVVLEFAVYNLGECFNKVVGLGTEIKRNMQKLSYQNAG